MRKVTFIILLMASCAIINAQETDSTNKVNYFKGKIVSKDNKALAFAHIINTRRGYAAVSNSGGHFSIPVVVGDSIKISTIGFHTRFYTVKTTSDEEQTIVLKSREYHLPTVNIYELRWQIFKSEFMEQVSEETREAQEISTWMNNLVSTEELKLIYQSTMAPGFRINYKSKKDKSRIRVKKMEKKYQIIAPKFNDELISNLTGLKGKEIYNFLQYCNFSEKFLINASEYEIMEQILVFWKKYKQEVLKD